MGHVFLSYSKKDHHFAELLRLKLREADIEVWQDTRNISVGTGWAKGIEDAIQASTLVIVAMSANSCESAYVTFEWSFALGMGRNLIPLKLTDCAPHVRLQPIQYLDFSIAEALPWGSLIDRIREVEDDVEVVMDPVANAPEAVDREAPVALGELDDESDDAIHVKAIIAYLNERGIHAMSFDNVRKRIDASLSDVKLNRLIVKNPGSIRHARLNTKKPGLARSLNGTFPNNKQK